LVRSPTARSFEERPPGRLASRPDAPIAGRPPAASSASCSKRDARPCRARRTGGVVAHVGAGEDEGTEPPARRADAGPGPRRPPVAPDAIAKGRRHSSVPRRELYLPPGRRQLPEGSGGGRGGRQPRATATGDTARVPAHPQQLEASWVSRRSSRRNDTAERLPRSRGPGSRLAISRFEASEVLHQLLLVPTLLSDRVEHALSTHVDAPNGACQLLCRTRATCGKGTPRSQPERVHDPAVSPSGPSEGSTTPCRNRDTPWPTPRGRPVNRRRCQLGDLGHPLGVPSSRRRSRARRGTVGTQAPPGSALSQARTSPMPQAAVGERHRHEDSRFPSAPLSRALGR